MFKSTIGLSPCMFSLNGKVVAPHQDHSCCIISDGQGTADILNSFFLSVFTPESLDDIAVLVFGGL